MECSFNQKRNSSTITLLIMLQASFASAESSTPNTSMVNSNSEGGSGLLGRFKQRITEAVANSSMVRDDL